MKQIKTGIFGTGFGLTVVLPAIKNNDKLKLIGIYGRNKKKLEIIKKKNNINIFNDFSSLVDKIDLAIIALPPFLQFKLAKFAILKGKHVLCEKPFTTKASEAKILLNLATKKKVYAAVSYQMRYQPLRLKIKKILSNKVLGNILSVKLSYDYSSRLYDTNKSTWKSDSRKGGGVLNAMGSHQIDLLRWLFGEIKSINGIKNKYNKIKNNKADDIFVGYVEFQNKLLCSISLSSVAIGWKTSYMDIYGDKASMHLEGEKNLYIVKKTEKNKQEASIKKKIIFKEDLFKKKWIDKSIWRSAYFRMLNSLSDSIVKKKKYKGASFKDALKIRVLLDRLIYR